MLRDTRVLEDSLQYTYLWDAGLKVHLVGGFLIKIDFAHNLLQLLTTK